MKNTLLPFLAVLAFGCKREMVDHDIPPALNFVLLDKSGNNLLTSTSTAIRVYSTTSSGQEFSLGSECQGGGCTMIRPAYGAFNYAFYYSSMAASATSQNGSKTWYLELAGKTDTLYLDVQQTRFKAVRFNGKAVEIDPVQAPLYVFQRLH